jgi:hypothetical protein
VVVLGRRSFGEWRSLEKTIVSVLLASSLGVVLFAFMPDLGSAAQLSPSTTWRVSAFLFASYHLVIVLASIVAIRRMLARGEPVPIPKSLLLPVFTAGFSVIAAQYATAMGLLGAWLFFFYLLGLLWFLCIATLCFTVLLLEAASPKPPA